MPTGDPNTISIHMRAGPLNPLFIVTFRWWIIDSIAATGTPAALRFIKEKFLKKELSVTEMAQVMLTSVHMVTATSETIEIFKVRLPQRESVSDKHRCMNLASLYCCRTW